MGEELDVTCVKTNWLGRLLGNPRFTINIALDDTRSVSGTGTTVRGAWETACMSARFFTSTTMQEDCPFDERGEPIAGGNVAEHRPCREWYCDPEKVSDQSLIKQLLEEGPHCEACGHDWPCAYADRMARTNQGGA